MTLTTIRKVMSFAVLAMAICALVASWVVFERPYGTTGTIASSIAPFIGIFLALGIVFAGAAFARKPIPPSNYPRMEHLRIAGKYHATGRFGEAGTSPFHLRG